MANVQMSLHQGKRAAHLSLTGMSLPIGVDLLVDGMSTLYAFARIG
jgi:hypothetical protein